MATASGIRTVGWLTFLNVLSALLAVVSTVIVAFFFGTGRSVEVYLAAVGLYASVVGLAQTGQVSEVLLPSYHSLCAARGKTEARRAFAALMNRFLVILAIVGLLGWILAPQLARLRIPGFASDDIALATEIFRWIIPLIVLQVTAELLKTLANAERMYGSPEVVVLVARLFALAGLVALVRVIGVWSMVVSLWIAATVECMAIFGLLWRRGYRHGLTLAVPNGSGNVGIFGKLWATLPYVGFTQVFAFALDAALSTLPQGSFAVFRYASMIWSRTQGIFLRPLSIPFFTEFSDSSARGLSTRVQLTETALSQVLAVAAIVTTAVLCGAERALVGLWQGDYFPPDKISSLVWLVAGLYTLLPLAGSAIILRKITVSLHRIRDTYLAMSVVQIVSAALAWALVPKVGLLGGLIVTAVNLIGFCLAPLAILRLGGSEFRFRYPFDRLWQWSTAAAIGTIVGMVADRGLDVLGVESGMTRIVDLAAGGLLAATGVAATLGVALLLKIPESRQLLSLASRVLNNRNSAGQ
jgi:putative peptidoglycan lipid II flippase